MAFKLAISSLLLLLFTTLAIVAVANGVEGAENDGIGRDEEEEDDHDDDDPEAEAEAEAQHVQVGVVYCNE